MKEMDLEKMIQNDSVKMYKIILRFFVNRSI